jgi:hypothetical protein
MRIARGLWISRGVSVNGAGHAEPSGWRDSGREAGVAGDPRRPGAMRQDPVGDPRVGDRRDEAQPAAAAGDRISRLERSNAASWWGSIV